MKWTFIDILYSSEMILLIWFLSSNILTFMKYWITTIRIVIKLQNNQELDCAAPRLEDLALENFKKFSVNIQCAYEILIERSKSCYLCIFFVEITMIIKMINKPT